MNDLRGKRVLVTGGGSGIGEAIVKEFVALGARVFIHYFSSGSEAQALVDTIRHDGGEAYCMQADLTKEDEAKSLLAKIAQHWNGLDILINNAGDLCGRSTMEHLDMDFYRKVIAVNLDSIVMVVREAIPLLKRNTCSSIVNLSSLAGRKGGHSGSIIYSVAKGGILTLTRSLSTELACYGIRVNAVAPGLILGSRFHTVHTTEESKNTTIADIPLGRAGNCEDVARAVVYLASEYDGFITGSTLDINGGVYLA